MGISLNDIKDPRLRAAIAGQLSAPCPPPCREAPVEAKRIRQDQKPLLNALETEYRDIYLRYEVDLCSQAMRFKLANGLWYKPDFFLPKTSTPTAIEVKGEHAFRGGFENLKMAAHQYPWIKWLLVWKDDNNLWCDQVILP